MPDTRLPLLEQVRVASPCPMKWEDMEGDDRVRFCGECRLQVFNLSNMAADEAEALLREHVGALRVRSGRRIESAEPCESECRPGGPNGALKTADRMCAGFFRRADGTIITRDCPVGLAALRRKTRYAAARMVAALGLAVGGVYGLARGADVRSHQPFQALCNWLVPGAAVTPPGPWIAGDICITPPPAATTQAPAPGGDAS